jgi:VanZ family protein
MRWLKRWFPAILWAAVISGFSTQLFSVPATSRFLLPLLERLFPGASPETLEMIHFLIRKFAHFAEYFIFSLLVLRGVRGEQIGWKFRWALAAIAIAACYAALDELHQAFVPERTASPYDSLLDSTGAVVAQLLAWLWSRRRAQLAEKRLANGAV